MRLPFLAFSLQIVAVRMASNRPALTPDAEAFVLSLRVEESQLDTLYGILQDLPEAEPKSIQETLEGQGGVTLVPLSCEVARIVFGDAALLDKPSIQDAVAESWPQTCWQLPSCIIRPISAKHVSQALKIALFFDAKFAVRSGGHSPNLGWASVEGGILIDLSELNQISVDESACVVSVGPGARWGDVYEYLDPYNVTAVGARIPQVGVGGFMLGGGISYFTGEHGLAIDNIESIEIVHRYGEIVSVSRTKHPDLFWALKGGGPNFGIVTRYDLRTIPIKNIWYQTSVFGPDKAAHLLDAFAEYQLSGDTRGSVSLVVTLNSVVVGLVHQEPMEKPDIFKPFYNIGPVAIPIPSTKGTVLSLSRISGANGTRPGRHDYRGASSKVDPDLYKAVYSFWKEKATSLFQNTGAKMTFVLQHIPKKAVDTGNENCGNALGLVPITQQWWTTQINWSDERHDDEVRSSAAEVTEKWEELAKARGSHLPFIHMNDASRDQDPLGSYGSTNIQRLIDVSKNYDPLQQFQRLQHGGFLLSRSKVAQNL